MPTAELTPPLRLLLRRVSRSFGISLAALPAGMRAPAGLGYLLARASDTIADTGALPPERRLAALDRFAAALGDWDLGTPVFWETSHHHPHEGERELMGRLPELFGLARALPPKDAADLGDVLGKIVSGQRLDLVRFGVAGGVLPDAVALEDYISRVAGCVGVFWTRLGFRHCRNFARRPRPEMEASGECYGRGLQLVNILRDFPADLRAGRCYLPAEELREAGVAVPPSEAGDASPVFIRWRESAFRYLAGGLRYAAAIRPWRLRFASVLPAVLGLATLREIATRFPQEGIKLTRAETRRWILRCACASPRRMERWAARAVGRREGEAVSAGSRP